MHVELSSILKIPGAILEPEASKIYIHCEGWKSDSKVARGFKRIPKAKPKPNSEGYRALGMYSAKEDSHYIRVQVKNRVVVWYQSFLKDKCCLERKGSLKLLKQFLL